MMNNKSKKIILASLIALTLTGSAGITDGLGFNLVQTAEAKTSDGYVELTVKPEAQAKIDPAELKIPDEVQLVDSKATPRTAALAAFLQGAGNSKYVLYGHQNDLHHKVNTASDNPSDTHDLVGDYPAVVGFDFQALEKGDFDLTEAEAKAGLTLIEKMARICEKGDKDGVIFTATAHMPNFAVVAKRGCQADGSWDYTGYTTPVTEGDVVNRIMPGGDLNEVYRSYMDMMADFGLRLQQADIPLIVRLFHENDGNWFWWGAAHCSPQQYKNLYRYTVEYLRDVRGVHNFIYAYSPGGPVNSIDDYKLRYPGDAFVDVLGMDMYHRNPEKDDAFMESFASSIKNISDYTQKHGKILAVTETGILTDSSAMPNRGNARKDWFREAETVMEKYPVAYFMTWSNNNANDFDQPYLISANRGHEMINQFVEFYNMPNSVFAAQLPAYRNLKVSVKPASAYGYILSVK